MLAVELTVALEDDVIQVDKILDSDCRDLFSEAATLVFSHLHLREPGFDFDSMILPIPTHARDSAAEAVKGPVEALLKRFARVVVPHFRTPLKPTTGKTTPLTPTTSPLKMERPTVVVSPDFFPLFSPAMHIVSRGGIKLFCILKNLLRLVMTS
ncbi:hypothetical protein D1007_17476 [Hordeum vulgare]|nr:hypothetical protein D1007_17476 [Hordeum vulgare]